VTGCIGAVVLRPKIPQFKHESLFDKNINKNKVKNIHENNTPIRLDFC